MADYPLLDYIEKPADLRLLEPSQLPQLCDELRKCLLDCVSQTGGHLASGLGVVELTVAIHYVFDTPKDSLVWDVGHQAYPHKILTERKARMASMKKLGGLSGFPKRDESPYDDFGVGHSSSLSADILVILNDNDMSISPNVGGLSSYLSKVLVSDLYSEVRSNAKQVLKHLPPFDGLAKFAEERVREIAGANNLFEDFGFDYSGPEDGHDVLRLVEVLTTLKAKKGPKLLHIKTVKGKGYKRAEDAPITYHGVSGFDPAAGVVAAASSAPTFTQVFSQWLVEMAQRDDKLLGITPAMREGSGLVEFSRQFPQRYFDVAIAEQHAVTLAAGMACKGAKPVVAIYSTFLQRAYDQLLHDVALQNLDVLFAVDRAGIVGEDGATHAGVFDLAYCRLIPNLVIMTPSDETEMLAMLNTGYAHPGPALVRYPKGSGSVGKIEPNYRQTLTIGKGKVVNAGEKVAILVFGTLLAHVERYAKVQNATLVDMRFVKPLDVALINDIAKTHQYVVVIEEGSLLGGVGEQIAQFIGQLEQSVKVLTLGVKDAFVAHGKREEVLAECGLDSHNIERQICAFIS